jgi:hypothetical protein
MDILVRFQLDHSQPPVVRAREYVQHGAIRSRKRRHLRIEATAIEPFVERAHIVQHQRLEPAFRVQPPQWLMPCSLRPSRNAQAAYQVCKVRAGPLFEQPLFRADPENNLPFRAERCGLVRQPRPRKLQPSPAERDLRRREHSDFTFR